MSALSQILEHRIVVILRGMSPSDTLNIAKALYNGGLRVLEITLNSNEALPLIEQLSHEFRNKMLIGAGTVLDTKDASNAIDAGASFLVSPTLDIKVIKTAKDADVVSIPGAFTPTEILTAFTSGADIIKVFPTLGADYIREILAPLNKMPLMPTGGINLENIKTFIASGAVAVGIGSALVQKTAAVSDTYFEELSRKAGAFKAALT